MTEGYSATPLAKKLGIREGFTISLFNQPEYYFNLFTDFPKEVKIVKNDSKVNFIHYFAWQQKELANHIGKLKSAIEQNGMIWISWPKKSSNVATDLSEDVVRHLALANGLVDIKVCAVDQTWSGLKLVIPVKNRK